MLEELPRLFGITCYITEIVKTYENILPDPMFDQRPAFGNRASYCDGPER